MSWTSFWTEVLNGVTFAGLLFLLASGFTLIFGFMRVANLAHGAIYLIGGYIGLTALLTTQNFWIGLLVGTLAAGAIGGGTERLLLRRLRGDVKPEVLLTIGLTFVIADLSLAGWGGNPRAVPAPDYLTGAIEIGSVFYPKYRLVLLGLAVAVGIVLFVVLMRTRIGAVVRAGVDDRETIAALGVNIDRVFTGVFVAGSMLAGFAGVAGGAMLSLAPGAEFEILLFGLVVVIIGGLGSLPGAAIGAVIVGLIDSFGTRLVPDLAFFTLFAPMALVLVIRPQGLFGRT